MFALPGAHELSEKEALVLSFRRRGGVFSTFWWSLITPLTHRLWFHKLAGLGGLTSLGFNFNFQTRTQSFKRVFLNLFQFRCRQKFQQIHFGSVLADRYCHFS